RCVPRGDDPDRGAIQGGPEAADRAGRCRGRRAGRRGRHAGRSVTSPALHRNVAARRIFTYAELAAVPAGDSDEPLVPATAYDREIVDAGADGPAVVVRETVA